MSDFKKTFTCDVCGQKITYPNFRIEWGHNYPHESKDSNKYDFIQVCHNECSHGISRIQKYPCTFGDIIFDQNPYSPEATERCLNQLSLSNPNLLSKIANIWNNIFE